MAISALTTVQFLYETAILVTPAANTRYKYNSIKVSVSYAAKYHNKAQFQSISQICNQTFTHFTYFHSYVDVSIMALLVHIKLLI